jgi:hypothetical protein
MSQERAWDILHRFLLRASQNALQYEVRLRALETRVTREENTKSQAPPFRSAFEPTFRWRHCFRRESAL